MKLSNEHLVPQIVFQDHCLQFSTEREVGISKGAGEGEITPNTFCDVLKQTNDNLRRRW